MCSSDLLNAEHARSEGHPDVVVSPLLVLCIVVGLSVEDLSEVGGPFLGIDDLTFHLPVHPGDTLTARSTVVDACRRYAAPTGKPCRLFARADSMRPL